MLNLRKLTWLTQLMINSTHVVHYDRETAFIHCILLFIYKLKEQFMCIDNKAYKYGRTVFDSSIVTKCNNIIITYIYEYA